MDKVEKSFELIVKYATNNRDLINFGIIIGLLAIAFFSSSSQISVAGVNKTTVLNFVNASSKINISQINSLETWNATYINRTNKEGSLINWSTRHFGLTAYSFIDAGTTFGSLAFGTSDDQPQFNNTSGMVFPTLSNKSIITLSSGVINSYAENDGNSTSLTQYNHGFTFLFNSGNRFIQIEDGIDPITGIPGEADLGGGLNMGGNPIYNSPTISYMWSTGVIQGGNLTFNNTTNTIYISSGLAMIRRGLNHTDQLITVAFAAKNFTIVFGETKFIYLDFAPPVTTTLQEAPTLVSILGAQQIQVYQVFLNDEFHYIDARQQNIDSGTKLRALLYETDRFKRASGAMLSNPSDLNVSVTSGRFFYGLNPINTPAMNTETGSLIEYYYHNATGSWFSYQAARLNETHYNPNGSTFVALLPNKYKVEWIYLVLDSANNSEIAVLFANNSYTSLVDAEAETVPSILPTELKDISVLIGRTIIKEGVLTPQATESTFTQVFLPSGVYDHNLLANLQGGQVSEYYHLNATQYNNVVSSILPTIKPSSPVLGNIFYNSTSHTTNCYDGGWRYCGNGTLI